MSVNHKALHKWKEDYVSAGQVESFIRKCEAALYHARGTEKSIQDLKKGKEQSQKKKKMPVNTLQNGYLLCIAARKIM